MIRTAPSQRLPTLFSQTQWKKGPPALLWDYAIKKKTNVVASLPRHQQAFAEAVWNG